MKTIKTKNFVIVLLADGSISYVKDRVTGKFAKHWVAMAELEQENEKFKTQMSDIYKIVMLAILAIWLFMPAVSEYLDLGLLSYNSSVYITIITLLGAAAAYAFKFVFDNVVNLLCIKIA